MSLGFKEVRTDCDLWFQIVDIFFGTLRSYWRFRQTLRISHIVWTINSMGFLDGVWTPKKGSPTNFWEKSPFVRFRLKLWFGLKLSLCRSSAIGRQSFWGLGGYVKLPGRLTSHSSVRCGSLVPDFADIRAAHVLFTPGCNKNLHLKTKYSLGHRNLRVRKRSQFSMDVQRNVVTSNLRPGRCFKVYFYSSYACISRAKTGPISAGSVSWKLGNQWVFESAPLVFGDMFMHGIWLQSWLLKFDPLAFSVFLAQGQLPSWFVWGPRKLSHARNRNVLVGFQSIGKRYGKMMRGFFNPTVHSIHREAKCIHDL